MKPYIERFETDTEKGVNIYEDENKLVLLDTLSIKKQSYQPLNDEQLVEKVAETCFFSQCTGDVKPRWKDQVGKDVKDWWRDIVEFIIAEISPSLLAQGRKEGREAVSKYLESKITETLNVGTIYYFISLTESDWQSFKEAK